MSFAISASHAARAFVGRRPQGIPGGAARGIIAVEAQAVAHHPLPPEHRRAAEKQDRERDGSGIDRHKEAELIDHGNPRPQKRKDCRYPAARVAAKHERDERERI